MGARAPAGVAGSRIPLLDLSGPSAASIAVLCLGIASLGALASGNANAVDLDVVVIAATLFAPLAAAVLLDARPRDPVGWLLAALGLAPPLLLATVGLGTGAVPDVATAALEAPHLLVAAVAVVLVGLPLALPSAPLGHLFGHVVAWTAGGVACLGLGAWLLHSDRQAVSVDRRLDDVERAALALLVPLAAAAVLRAVVLCRRAHGQERHQIAWALIGLAGTLAGGAATRAVTEPAVQTYLLAGLVATGPIGLVALRLAPRLRPVDGALLRVGLLTGAASALALVWEVLRVVLDRTSLPDPGSAAAVATGCVALVLVPVYASVRDTALERFLGTARPGVAMDRLGRSVDAADDLDDAMDAATRAVAAAVRSPQAEVLLGEEDAAVEHPPGAAVLPLVAAGGRLGVLVVAPRRVGEHYARRDLDLLALLVTPIAQLARAVVLSRDLERARGDAVAQRLEERRSLRRDLHDSIGPLLAGLGLQTEAVRRARPDESRLEAVVEAVAACRREVRRLVDGLDPDDQQALDLEVAVRELVEGWASATVDIGLRLEVDIPVPLPLLGERVRRTAYRVVGEALTNVVRHAGAAQCVVRLVVDDGDLLVEVRDDGRGPEPRGARPGVGLRSMHERATELGGDVVVAEGPSSGTVVRARLPVGAP